MELGEIGIWTSSGLVGEGNLRAAAKLAEDLGFGTLWLGGSPRLPAVRPLLEATERLVVATGVLNVWQNEPADVAAQYAELEGEFPDRVLLGIGIGHPEATSGYAQPLATMRAFLDGLDNAVPPVPPIQRCLAALGPKMLDLSAERTRGAHPYFVPVAHTRFARERIGDNALLAPEVACVLDTDPERGRASARKYARRYLALDNYASNLLRLGFTEQDLAEGGSDRLIDDVVPHGSASEIAVAVRAHLSAGADHVCVQTVGPRGLPHEEWAALASALIG